MLSKLRLRECSTFAIDTETFDPFLIEDGPGWGRHVGHLIGISLATKYAACYICWKSKDVFWDDGTKTAPESGIAEYLNKIFRSSRLKVGANLMYDIGWLSEAGMELTGPYFDVIAAEKVLNPGKMASLDTIAKDYLGIGKTKADVERYNQEYFPTEKNFRQNLWKMPVHLVANYAIDDATLPLKLMELLSIKLEEVGLSAVFDIECRLMPLLVKIRQRGMRYDIEKVYETREQLLSALNINTLQLVKDAGEAFNPNSSKQIAKILEARGINLPKTRKGNPSATQEILTALGDPFVNNILENRSLNKTISTFINGVIINKGINGHIYPELKPLAPITGRFSCSQPNGQFIPSRDQELAPLIRGMFIPDDGYSSWLKLDYSQIEYRMLAHVAKDSLGNDSDVDTLIAAFQSKDADYHTLVQTLIKEQTGLILPRKPVKNINFGLVYGMALPKLTRMIATMFPEEDDPSEYAQSIIDAYLEGFPVPRKLMEHCIKDIRVTQETRTILNRRVKFDQWECSFARKLGSFPKQEAIRKFRECNITVAGAYKAVNYRLQGSAADYIKLAMVLAYEQGLFDKTGYPHIQVHDELDFSYHPDLKNDFKELVRCMEHAYQLHVPMVMGAELGPDWGHVKEVDL